MKQIKSKRWLKRHITNKKRKKSKKKRLKDRTWTNGRLITFVSLDIFKGEHRFICQMRRVNEYFKYHRCLQCKIYNHFRPCMDIGGEMHTKCMHKSDLSCYPKIVKRLRSIPSLP